MARPRVFVCRQLPAEALAPLTEACDCEVWESAERPVPRDVLLAEASRADGLLTLTSERVDAELLAAAPRLRAVANVGAGYENVDTAACTRRGVLVTNTPDVLNETVADLTIGLMLAAARRIVEGHQLIARGQWTAFAPMFMTGMEVHGAVLGIVGCGRIGAAVARRAAHGFRMRVLYHNRHRNPAVESEAGAEYRDRDDLLREADFVVVLTPLTAETRGLIGARELALMKPTAVLVNVARGPVVDEGALYRALADRRIFAAAVDVYNREPVGADHPFLALPNVVCTPRLGSATVQTRIRMFRLAAENLAAALRGERPPTPVNPEVLG